MKRQQRACLSSLFAACVLLQLGGAMARPAAETACSNPDWFAVRQAYLEGKPLTALCKGQLQAAEGQMSAAEQDLGAIVRGAPKSEDAYQARSTLAHVYFRLGRFHDAEAQLAAMALMKPGAADVRNVGPLYVLLARSADVAVDRSEPATVSSKMIEGNVFAPVTVNGTETAYMVDTGMNLSMMSESEAA
ncbi:MAG TPA: hypothetical protein VMH20_00085, partial [Verrucomicrobiae bacterium]|nr:hypothetical protein [Verrucomicrobiae bacterium]